ncbi:MAG: carboxypeptidase regulatory-like domain-containing protein [Pyrinomonadaceae bacterium]
MKLKRTLCIIGMLLMALASAASFPVGKSKPQAVRKAYQRTGDEGIVTGTVLFAGRRPTGKHIDMSADPACGMKHPNPMTELIGLNKRRLANVFVYIKRSSALDELSFEPPRKTVILDQQGCRFVPHVLGIQTSQVLKILNSDPTTHNIHPAPKNNTEWNVSQPPGAGPLVKQFTRAEVMIPIKCNQHPWMKAYLGVLSHPFFSVSDRNGAFRIEGLPAGNYTIAAWHEQLGEKTIDLTILPRSQQNVDFKFSSSDHWPADHWRTIAEAHR